MSQHLSRTQLVKFNHRELHPGELLAVDSHLAACEECRRELAGIASPVDSMLSAIEHASAEHLTYEQMDAWVDEEMDQSERELVAAHIELCALCARQLKAYESYAPVMSAPLVPPAEPVHSIGDRIRAWFRISQVAMGAAAAGIVLILGPLVLLNTQQKNDGLNLAPFDQLPGSVQAGARAVITGNSAERPESLEGLTPNPDANLTYPVSEVVEERQPILRWKSTGGPYDVAIFDSEHREVARTSEFTENHWLVPQQLTRGALYTWELRANGQARSASFRILSEADEAKLAGVRAANMGSLALGAVAQQLGLLSIAQDEFEQVQKLQPESRQAEKLLVHLKQLRGR